MTTEERNARFEQIDQWSTDQAVRVMLDTQIDALYGVKSAVASIAAAAEAAAVRLKASAQSRLIYAGAGTSGRIAVQDGVELTPTFGWGQDRLVFVMAGGMQSLAASSEDHEDRPEEAYAAMERNSVSSRDVVIAVAASGITPFTLEAARCGKTAGALTIGITNNAGSALADLVDIPLVVDTGAEVIAGSTRMKAGTVQKVILNLLSTAIMVRLGRVYRGLMVDMQVSNIKLEHRAVGIIAEIACRDHETAARALDQAEGNIKLAILLACDIDVDRAKRLLLESDGVLGPALQQAGLINAGTIVR